MISYPYLPEGRTILYVPAEHPFMQAAKEEAREHSLDTTMPTGAVIVKNGEIVGRGANGSTYHENNECERVKQNMPTGQGYELCEGCHPKNHAERRAVESAATTDGADLYLWGHWWACEPCWSAMIEAGVSQVYLMEDSQILFDKTNSENIVGKQFSS